MAYLAIARKWRPTRFEDLVGQAHVVQTLRNAIQLERVSHAYLFSGARGVGKTSVARIFAKALRCPNAKDALPCNACSECISVSESRSVDVVEIDGASNNGVEAVRGIRENVAYGASSGYYKIFIIDEVHMLSLSAFNALLKTLEEPPAHVIFIFATTESQKIPLTILSRCQRFEFRRLAVSQIVERLKYILAEEKVSISDEGLRLIAAAGDGSLRDSQSLLDQVLSFFGGKSEPIDEKSVVTALGVADSSHVTGLLDRVVKQDIKGLITLIEEVYLSGVDLKHFAERCLEETRYLYLIVLGRDTHEKATAESLELSAGHFHQLSDIAQATSLLQVERMAQILSKAITQLGWSSLPRFVLEMAAVRMAKLELLARIESGGIALQERGPSPEPEPVASPIAKASPLVEPAAPPPVAAAPAPRIMVAPPVPPAAAGASGQSWQAFVDSVMKKRPLLGALLGHASFKLDTQGDKKIVFLAFPEGSFYAREASDPRKKSDIEELVRNFFGKETQVSFGPGGVGNVTPSLEASKQAEAASLKKAALEHPTVIKMKEILGAEVVDVNVEV